MQSDIADLIDHAVTDWAEDETSGHKLMRWAPQLDADKLALDAYTRPHEIDGQRVIIMAYLDCPRNAYLDQPGEIGEHRVAEIQL
jgi:hypothetical protein